MIRQLLSFVLAFPVVGLIAAQSEAQTVWVGTTNDILTASNWNPAAVPTITTTPAANQEARFSTAGSHTPQLDGTWNPRYVGFDGVIPVSGYIFNGSGTLTVGTNGSGNIDTFLATGGDVVFNIANIVMTRGINVYAGSFPTDTATYSNLVINSASFKMGFGASSGNPGINSMGGNVTFNTPVDLSGSTVNRSVNVVTDTPRTTSLNNGFIFLNGATNRLSSVNFSNAITTSTSQPLYASAGTGPGRVVLGINSVTGAGASASWTGAIGINRALVEIASPDALGTNGSPSGAYTQMDGTNANGAIVFTNSITSGEYFYLSGRKSDFAHIINKSGNNKTTGTIVTDFGNATSLDSAASAADTLYRIQSNAGSLEISGPLSQIGTGFFGTNTAGAGQATSGVGTLTFGSAAAATGLVSGVISETKVGFKLNIVKDGLGTWTFSNVNTYSGATTIAAGTLALTGTGSIAATSSISVLSGATFDVSGLSGTFALTGTQALRGAGTVSGTLATGSSTSIAPGDSGVGTLIFANGLNLNGGTLAFELSNVPSGTNDKITVGGNLTLANTTNLAVTQTNGGLSNGTYTILTYSGTLTGSASNFSISGVGGGIRQIYNFSTATPNQINLVVTGPGTPSSSLTWVGGGSNPWDVVTTANWSGGSGGDNRFYSGDSVTFSDTGSNAPPIAIASPVSPNAVTFTNSASHPYMLGGALISSTGALIVSGSGDVTFNNTALTVGTTLTASGSGTITFGSTSSTTINSDMTLSNSQNAIFNSPTTSIGGNLSAGGSGLLTFASPTSTTINGSFGVSNTQNVTVSSTSFNASNYSNSGSGLVQFIGGNVTLTGTLAQSGTGQTLFANTGGLNIPTNITVSGGKLVLRLTPDVTVTNIFTGAGTLRKEGTNTVTLSSTLNGLTGTVETGRNLSDPSSTAGVLILNGSNATFAGPIVVESGVLSTRSTTALGTGGSASNGVNVADGATFDVGTNGGTNPTGFTNKEVVTAIGTGFDGKGAVVVGQGIAGTATTAHIGQLVLTGDTTVGAYGVGTSPAGGRSLFYIDGAGGPGVVGNGFGLTVVTNPFGNTSSTIGNGTETDFFNIVNPNLSSLNLSGGGELFIGGTTNITSGTVNLNVGGRLGFYASNNTVGAFTGTFSAPIIANAIGAEASIDSYDGNATLDSSITLNSALETTVYNGVNNSTSTLKLTGKITGSSNLSFHLLSSAASRLGVIQLTNSTSDFTGNVTIGGGMGGLNVTPANDSIIVSVGDGGTTGNLGGDTVNNVYSPVFIVNPATLMFNRNATYTVNNLLYGDGAVTLVAANGVVTFAADNQYTGTTTVNGGTLVVTGNAFAANGALQVNGGDGVAGTLRGSGTVGGAVTVIAGSGTTPIPGSIKGGAGANDKGTLTLNQGLTIGAGGRLIVQLGQPAATGAAGSGASTANLGSPTSTNSFIHIVGGTSGFDNGMVIKVDASGANFATSTNYSYTVIDGGGAVAANVNITDPNSFSLTGFNVAPASISLTGDAGGFLYLNFTTSSTPVPEPALLLGAASLALLGLRRRK